MVADPRRSRARSRSPVHVRSRRPMRPVSVRSIPARRGSGSLAGSKRNVVLYPLSHGPDLLDQVGEIAAVLDEVDVRAVDHQERGLRVTVKVIPERLRQPLQVLRGDAALEVPVALAEPAQQHLRPGLEIDDEVRRHPHPEREIAGPTRRVYGGEPTYGQPPTPCGIIPQSARDSTWSGDGSGLLGATWPASASACELYLMIALPPTIRLMSCVHS